MRGDLEMVKLLLKHDCDPEIPSHYVAGTQFSGKTPIGLASHSKGCIFYLKEGLKGATVWEISAQAQFALQQLWQKCTRRYPRMEGVMSESGVESFDPKHKRRTIQMKISNQTKRIFVLGISSLMAYNYTLSGHNLDKPVMRLSFQDPTIKIDALEESTNYIKLSSQAPGFDFSFVMELPSKTAKHEWLAALKARFQQKRNTNPSGIALIISRLAIS